MRTPNYSHLRKLTSDTIRTPFCRLLLKEEIGHLIKYEGSNQRGLLENGAREKDSINIQC